MDTCPGENQRVSRAATDGKTSIGVVSAIRYSALCDSLIPSPPTKCSANNNQQDHVATAGGDRQQQYADKTRMTQQGEFQHRVVHPPAAYDKRHEQPPTR